jgi:hypothetical protein
MKELTPKMKQKINVEMKKDGSCEFTCGSKNTDREIWRRIPEDYYSPSIHVTAGGAIGINVGGEVIVKTVEQWHDLDKRLYCCTVENIRRCSKISGQQKLNKRLIETCKTLAGLAGAHCYKNAHKILNEAIDYFELPDETDDAPDKWDAARGNDL